MPYIEHKERKELDPLIDALAEKIGTGYSFDHSAGRINYAVTRLILLNIGPPKYYKIVLMCGMLHNIVTEFYRKFAAPYEDKKITENGDVYSG